MPRVEILRQTTVFRQLFMRIEAVHLRHERYDGSMSPELLRLSFEHGDGVAALVHDTAHDHVILVEQFRYSTYKDGPGWLLEVPAGRVESHEYDDLAGAIRRELHEEIGFTVNELRLLRTFYLSPGISSERTFLFYARVTADDRLGMGGGLDAEDEDLRVVSLPVAEALARLDGGDIQDARTIIGLEWLRRQRET
jgi:nudix-type nucleoside diphosphatase (YffH/AdpP family)